MYGNAGPAGQKQAGPPTWRKLTEDWMAFEKSLIFTAYMNVLQNDLWDRLTQFDSRTKLIICFRDVMCLSEERTRVRTDTVYRWGIACVRTCLANACKHHSEYLPRIPIKKIREDYIIQSVPNPADLASTSTGVGIRRVFHAPKYAVGRWVDIVRQ